MKYLIISTLLISFSTMANEVVLSPGSSVTVKPTVETKVTCTSVSIAQKPVCEIVYKDGRYYILMNAKTANTHSSMEDAIAETELLINKNICL